MSKELTPLELAEEIITFHWQDMNGLKNLRLIVTAAEGTVNEFLGDDKLDYTSYEDRKAVACLLALLGAYYLYDPFHDDAIDETASVLVEAKLSDFFGNLWCSK